jgi:hypothetical protein
MGLDVLPDSSDEIRLGSQGEIVYDFSGGFTFDHELDHEKFQRMLAQVVISPPTPPKKKRKKFLG